MTTSQTELRRRLQALMNRKENQVCVDCPEKSPRWASLIVPPADLANNRNSSNNLPIGAFCCLECSGSHRRLGVHIAFVRSINLDQWKEKEVLAMENGGNDKVNTIFEARLPSQAMKIQAGANGPMRERYIRDKYERRKFYDASAVSELQLEEEESDSEEEEGGVSSASANSVSRATAAARMRVEAKSKNTNNSSPPQRVNKLPIKMPKASRRPPVSASGAVPEVDLLDFGSFSTSNVSGTPPAPPSQPGTPTANDIGDLFGGMTMSSSKPSSTHSATQNSTISSSQTSTFDNSWTSEFVSPAENNTNLSQAQQTTRKTNADILAMFNAGPQGNGMTGMQNTSMQIPSNGFVNNVSMPMTPQQPYQNGNITHHQQTNMMMQNGSQLLNYASSNMHNIPMQVMYNQQMMVNNQQQMQFMQQSYKNFGQKNQSGEPAFETHVKQQEQQMMMMMMMQQQQQQGSASYMQHQHNFPN